MSHPYLNELAAHRPPSNADNSAPNSRRPPNSRSLQTGPDNLLPDEDGMDQDSTLLPTAQVHPQTYNDPATPATSGAESPCTVHPHEPSTTPPLPPLLPPPPPTVPTNTPVIDPPPPPDLHLMPIPPDGFPLLEGLDQAAIFDSIHPDTICQNTLFFTCTIRESNLRPRLICRLGLGSYLYTLTIRP